MAKYLVELGFPSVSIMYAVELYHHLTAYMVGMFGNRFAVPLQVLTIIY